MLSPRMIGPAGAKRDRSNGADAESGNGNMANWRVGISGTYSYRGPRVCQGVLQRRCQRRYTGG